MAKDIGYSSPWLSLTEALEHVNGVVGEAVSWSQIRQAMRNGALPARGLLDGAEGEISGDWLTILAFDDPEADILWFDNERRHKLTPPAPACAERVEIDGRLLEELWPPNSDIENIFKWQYWSLWQMLAWVHSQDKSLVAVSVDGDGPQKLWHIGANYTVEGGPSFGDSQGDVLNHLRSGNLDSYDLPPSGGTPVKIDALQWNALKFFDDPARAAVDERAQETVRPYFPVKQVLVIWKATGGGAAPVKSAVPSSASKPPNQKRKGGKRPGEYIPKLKSWMDSYHQRYDKDGGVLGADNTALAREFVRYHDNRKIDPEYKFDLPGVNHLRGVIGKLKAEYS